MLPDYTNEKYKNNMIGFYNDLVALASFRDAYCDSLLTLGNCNKDLSSYIKRENNLEFLSSLVYLEGKIYENYPEQLSSFSEALESEFRRTAFIPSDTSYSRRMEEIFINYLYHLINVKCKGVNTKNDFSKLLECIQDYPNLFVKEYLFCFLVINFSEVWKKYQSEDVVPYISNIINPILRTELKNYGY